MYFDFTEESMEESQSNEGKDKDGRCVNLKDINRKRKELSVQYKTKHKKKLAFDTSNKENIKVSSEKKIKTKNKTVKNKENSG